MEGRDHDIFLLRSIISHFLVGTVPSLLFYFWQEINYYVRLLLSTIEKI
jgi:hypothetical protein